MISIAELVERGLQLRKSIKRDQDELKKVEAALEAAGLARPEQHQELKDADREGRRWLAKSDSHILPVVFTADKLVGSFTKDSAKHQTIRASLGPRADKLSRFFKLTATYTSLFEDGKDFRKAAREELAESAPPFITACVARGKDGIAKSDVKILWEDVEEKTK